VLSGKLGYTAFMFSYLGAATYITVDFATASSSQNGFNTFKLSLHKNTNIVQKMSKTYNYFHLLSLSGHETSLLLI
jgi:hypothetical protein